MPVPVHVSCFHSQFRSHVTAPTASCPVKQGSCFEALSVSRLLLSASRYFCESPFHRACREHCIGILLSFLFAGGNPFD